jgi:flagellar basal-body rod protein FlgF
VTTYIVLSRQAALMAEMQTIANNIANLSTSGFRREGVVFSEFVSAAPGSGPSVSLTAARVRNVDLTQGALSQTGGAFDLAIEGEGFFLVGGPDGERLTRAGRFSPNAAGELVTPDGLRLLGEGGTAVAVPPEAGSLTVARDGSVSADGLPLNRIGLVLPTDPNDLRRESGALFRTEGGVEPTEAGTILQGFVEEANVDPVLEIARMIEVQRAYELGQSFMEQESERRSDVIRTLTRPT